MDFDFFLKTYCSRRLRARFSVLTKVNYLDDECQFLQNTQNNFYFTSDDLSLSAVLDKKLVTIKDITVKNTDLLTRNDDLPSQHLSKHLEHVIEYIAEPPTIKREGCVCIKDGENIIKIPVTDTDEVFVIKDQMIYPL